MILIEEEVPTEGKAVITTVSLPAELAEGQWITGYIRIKNEGESDNIACVLHTRWDDKLIAAYGYVDAGFIARFDLADGAIEMPNQDAVIDIYGCHEEAGGEYVVDGRPFKVDDMKSH